MVVTACLVALALAGCGKKGPLEPAPTSQVPTPSPAVAQAQQAQQARVLDNADQPGLLQPPDVSYQPSAIAQLNSSVKNPARPINAPPIPGPSTFVLDPLVK